jgi:hypothetical protein
VKAIQQAVFEALAGYAGLSQLVGARVYADVAKQGVSRPYVVWQEISTTEVNDLSGSAETSGTHNYRIQVTFWAVDATRAREGNKQVKLAMIAASGIKSLAIDTRALPYEPDTKLHGMQTDFSVWIRT